MPISPSLELQGIIIPRLKDFAAVKSLIQSRVYDHVPRDTQGNPTSTFPYVSLGPINGLPANADCIIGSEITLQLDVWSRAVGKVEAQKICFAIRQALTDYEFELTENALVSFEYSSERIFPDSDVLTTHGVLTFTAFVEVKISV